MRIITGILSKFHGLGCYPFGITRYTNLSIDRQHSRVIGGQYAPHPSPAPTQKWQQHGITSDYNTYLVKECKQGLSRLHLS
jgi:hypothetical protein